MGKEQDLLLAVKSGDALLANKLLSKVKCNEMSEYSTNIIKKCMGLINSANGSFRRLCVL